MSRCSTGFAVSERASPCGDCALASHDAARRRFVAQSLIATIGLLTVGACGDGEIGGPAGPSQAPTLDPSLLVVLADFPALGAVGGIERVDGGTNTPVAVTRVGAQEYLAFSMVCPHAGYSPINIMSYGFRCPNHGARFDPDGAWSGGQRTSSLREYTVVLNVGAGTLAIS